MSLGYRLRGRPDQWSELITRTLAHSPTPMSVKQLATAMGTTSGTAGKYLALAEGRGLVEMQNVGTMKLVQLTVESDEPPKRLHRSAVLNSLHEGDCLHVMPSIPDHSIDMVLCDLPYGTTQNKWDSVIPLDRLWREYKRVVKPSGAIVLTSQGIFTALLMLSNESEFKYKIVWEKSKPTNFLNAKKQPLRKHEDICVFYRNPPTYNPQMGKGAPYDKGVRKNQLSGSYGDFSPVHVQSQGQRYPTDVIYHKTAESEGPVWHPTQKPVGLGRYLIRTFSKPGDLILDNAFGSGSFLVAGILEGRNVVGIEKNAGERQFKVEDMDYLQVARERLDAAYTSLNPDTKKKLAAPNWR